MFREVGVKRRGAVSTTHVPYLGLLVFTAVWTATSESMIVGAVRAGDKVPSLGWAVPFTISSLAAVYCFSSLVSRGGAA